MLPGAVDLEVERIHFFVGRGLSFVHRSDYYGVIEIFCGVR